VDWKLKETTEKLLFHWASGHGIYLEQEALEFAQKNGLFSH